MVSAQAPLQLCFSHACAMYPVYVDLGLWTSIPDLTSDLYHHHGLAQQSLDSWPNLVTITRPALLFLLRYCGTVPLPVWPLPRACLAVTPNSSLTFPHGVAGPCCFLSADTLIDACIHDVACDLALVVTNGVKPQWETELSICRGRIDQAEHKGSSSRIL